jgi:hypothetical protein
MAANILKTAYASRATLALEPGRTAAEAAGEGVLSPWHSAMALAVAAAAMLLVAAPALVAVLAIASPGELDRVWRWLLGGSFAFSVVAAGRVPAAALLALVLSGRRTGP